MADDAREKEMDARLSRDLRLSAAERDRRLGLDYMGALFALDVPKVPAPKPGEHMLIVGITGSGKSTTAKALVARWAARVAVWDPLDEHSIWGVQTEQVMLGALRRRITIDELRNSPGILDEPDLRAAIVPTRKGQKGRAQDFADFVDLLALEDQPREDEIAEAAAGQPLIVVVEEVPRLAQFCTGEFEALACVSRHSGVAVVAVAQYASGIPHPLRRQCRRIVAHAQTWDLDIDALAQPMGDDRAELVRSLRGHDSITWDREADPSTAAA